MNATSFPHDWKEARRFRALELKQAGWTQQEIADALGVTKGAVSAWIFAGGAHHTSFSYAVPPEHLRDFADMAGLEFLLIDENTKLEEFKKELRWNDLYYQLNRGL